LSDSARRQARCSAASCSAPGARPQGATFWRTGCQLEHLRRSDPARFGAQEVAGTISWATDIIEDKNTRTEGDGLFGGGQKITEYRYYANFAVAFAEGPCTGLLRLWAGEKLLADLQAPDLTPGGTDSLSDAMRYFVRNKRYRFRFHRGTADQEPDPLIVKHIDKEVGANATPAFRDLVYLVFERLPLDEFGNRIPPITAEIAWTSIEGAAGARAAFHAGAAEHLQWHQLPERRPGGRLAAPLRLRPDPRRRGQARRHPPLQPAHGARGPAGAVRH
jgi:hypothetical protein